jgi:hypothetical protein
MLGVEAGGPQSQGVGVRLALEPGLGQRRALIRGERLVADQGDLARPAQLT